MDNEQALRGAIEWLLNIRAKAEDLPGLALILLDTQPDNISLTGLMKVKDDPRRLTDSEKELCRQGKIVPAAVKAVRERCKLAGLDIGLKESKAIVDAWVDAERAAGRLPPRIPGMNQMASARPPIPVTPAYIDPNPTPAEGILAITEEDIASFAKEASDDKSYPLARRDPDATPATGTHVVYGGEG